MNNLIQASIGDAMSWSNIEDEESVKSLNRPPVETSILTAVPAVAVTLRGLELTFGAEADLAYPAI